jgi:hypothetical protein
MKRLNLILILCLIVVTFTAFFLRASQTKAASQSCGQWSIETSQNPGPFISTLSGVAATAANDVWAVGEYRTSSGLEQTLAEHWNGTQWHVVASPSPGTSYNVLAGIARIPNSNQFWAVGYYDNQGLIELWNGTGWHIVSSPTLQSGAYLTGITALSPTDAWAVGISSDASNQPITLTEHWNGTSWSVVQSPSPGFNHQELLGVAAVSATNVWAVGDYDNRSILGEPIQTLVEHWNGTSWSIISSPNPGSSMNYLNGAARVPGTRHIWAVGTFDNMASANQSLAEYWNGTSWSVAQSPNVGTSNNAFNAVAAISQQNVWAVGYYDSSNNTSQTLIEHWNGTSWSVVQSPDVGSDNNELTGVARIPSASQVWSVGEIFPGSGGSAGTLTEFYC